MSLVVKTWLEEIIRVVEFTLKKSHSRFSGVHFPYRRKRRSASGWNSPNKVLRQLNAIHMSYVIHEKPGDEPQHPEPLIILHEVLGSKNDWVSIAKALAHMTKRRIVTADLRNHGCSPHTFRCSYDYIVEDIQLLFQTLKATKAVLLGHGMGGRAAMLFAHDYPKLLDRLLVVDITPMGVASCYKWLPFILKIMNEVVADGKLSLISVRELTHERLENYWPNCDVREFLLHNLLQRDDGEYYWRINIDAIKRDFFQIASFPKLLSACSVPTFFIAGNCSDCVKAHDIKRLRRFFKPVKIKFIQGAHHWPQIENRYAFLASVADALDIKEDFKLVDIDK